MRHRHRTVMAHQRGTYESRVTARTKAAFLTLRGVAHAAARGVDIAALPSKRWSGQRVYRMTCDADFGKGPHEVWLPARVLWSLIDLQRYRCVFH